MTFTDPDYPNLTRFLALTGSTGSTPRPKGSPKPLTADQLSQLLSPSKTYNDMDVPALKARHAELWKYMSEIFERAPSSTWDSETRARWDIADEEIRTVTDVIEAKQRMAEIAERFLSDDAVPSALLVTSKPLTPAQVRQARERWEQRRWEPPTVLTGYSPPTKSCADTSVPSHNPTTQ